MAISPSWHFVLLTANRGGGRCYQQISFPQENFTFAVFCNKIKKNAVHLHFCCSALPTVAYRENDVKEL